METLEGFDFAALRFDADGKLTNPAELDELKTRAATATDALFLAHGFRNSEADARDLYSAWLRNIRTAAGQFPDLAGIGQRKFVAAGVFWPSKALPEDARDRAGGNVQSADDDASDAERESARRQLQEARDEIAGEDQKPRMDRAMELIDQLQTNPQARDEFAACVKSLLDDVELEENEGLDEFRSLSGREALKVLKDPVVLPAAGADGSNVSSLDPDLDSAGGTGTGETEGFFDVVGSVFGAAARFVNLTTWYVMKSRSGTVGANGVAAAVRQVLQAKPDIRVHLIGHSLGGRLMSACAKSLDASSVASLNLLEAAFSHYGFSTSPKGAAGFFRDVLNKNVVRGPIIATYSAADSVVGLAYALASRLAGDNVQAIGDENDEYGGIGRNGTQRLATARRETLHQPGQRYSLGNQVVTNLNGSGGLITSHGDVTNPTVCYAIASAIAAT